ncbi:MAG TPA: efflux RND transporter periplasmic adaptor subunit [Bryobacteraceae bacterium]|nr:efflux RND transporter periplasmic adaptor subunit [Bryobacteraceae bacterium]
MKYSGFIGALAVILLSSGCNRPDSVHAQAGKMPVVAVRVVPAVTKDIPLDIASIGNVEAVSSVDVKSRIAGQVSQVRFESGQDVQAGQVLFQIDSEPLLRQIAELEANIARDVAQEKQALANVAKDEAQLKSDKSKADRGRQLAQEGVFSKEQTETLVSAADASQASLDADRAAVESGRAAKRADEAKLAQTKLQLDYSQITAPISGRTGAIAIKPGNLVKDNDTTLVTILQTTPIYVSFAVPEQLLPQVRKYNNQHPLVVEAVTADNTTVQGKLDFIDNTVDTTTGTIKLKAMFDNQARKLWPGQFVNVRARLDVEQGRVVVPARTVQSGPQGKYVWVVNSDDTVAMRQVQVLRNYTNGETSEQAVIGSGVEAGENIISEGQMLLMPGAKVRVLKANSSSEKAAAGNEFGTGS